MRLRASSGASSVAIAAPGEMMTTQMPESRHLLRVELGERDQRVFRRRVGKRAGRGEAAAAVQVHDVPAAALLHVRHGVLGGEEGAAQRHAHHGVPEERDLHVLHLGPARLVAPREVRHDRRVVDEYVDAAESLVDLRHERCHGILARNVRGDGHRLRAHLAEFPHRLLQASLVYISDGYLGAFLSEAVSDIPPDTLRGTGDYNGLVLQHDAHSSQQQSPVNLWPPSRSVKPPSAAPANPFIVPAALILTPDTLIPGEGTDCILRNVPACVVGCGHLLSGPRGNR